MSPRAKKTSADDRDSAEEVVAGETGAAEAASRPTRPAAVSRAPT
jgi:hypothetical protein